MNDKHDCSELIDRFETLVRGQEMSIQRGGSGFGRGKNEELVALRQELKVLLRVACANNFDGKVLED